MTNKPKVGLQFWSALVGLSLTAGVHARRSPGMAVMSAVRIFRYEVPVDDKPHTFQLHGDPLAVGCRVVDVVEFWAAHLDGLPEDTGRLRSFQVVGTGHPLPQTGPGRSHWGTAAFGPLVWHLIEVPAVPS